MSFPLGPKPSSFGAFPARLKSCPDTNPERGRDGFGETADPSASPGACDLFIFRCRSRPESSQEHLPTSIAGVLRLRGINPSLCDRSARRFAQDDGFDEV